MGAVDRTEQERSGERVVVRVRDHAGFVGRDRELSAVTRLLTGHPQAHGGRGIVVEGDAGIGKSRLVTEALARAPGVRVLRGGADPLGRHRVLGAVVAALGPLDPSRPTDAHLRRLLESSPGQTPPLGPQRRSPLIDACVAAVAARAGEARVALVLEDLHWADDGTVAVFGELSQALPGRDVVVVATRRRTSRELEVRSLEAAWPGHVEVLELRPLDRAAVTELVTERVGRAPTPELATYVDRAGGNPLYVTELVDALAEQGSLVAGAAPAAPAELVHVSLPPGLRVTLLRRLSALPDAALEALRVAALLGASFVVEDLAIGLDEPLPRTVERLDEPLRAGWLQGCGDRLTFRHDLVREVLHDDVPEAIRRGLHRHLADRLADAGRDPSEGAHHFLRGATPPDADAAAWLRAAARSAASREPRLAVELLDAATRLDPSPGRLHDAMQLELAVARCWAGQLASGEDLLRDLLGRPHDPAVDAPAALALARSLILRGASEEALRIIRAAVERSESERQRCQLIAELALCTLLRGDLVDAAGAVGRVLGSADASDESRCVAHTVQAALFALEGHVGDAVRRGRQAVEIAATSADRETVRRPPQLLLGSVLLDADRFDEGRRLLDEGRRISEQLGAVWDLPLVHLIVARGHYLTGDHDDSLTEAEAAVQAAEEVGTRVLEVWAHAIAAHIHLHRSAYDAARGALEAGEAVIARVGLQVRGTDWLVWARARLAQMEGQDDVARHLLVALWEGYRQRGIRSERRLIGPDLVRVHLGAGDQAGAEAVADAVDELAALARTPSTTAAALHLRGLVERDAARLVTAATASAAGRCRTEHVGQALDAADQLVADGQEVEATAWFERAAEVARTAGMTRSVRRAEAGLRGLGVRRGVRGTRARPRTGWTALTPTEGQVAELAAQGLSNPEIGEQLFISRRTVQTHLSHVYGKLGVGSRVELATLVAQRARPS